MSDTSPITAQLLKELQAEATATRKCLENVPEKLFDWKPHEKSMNLGYLALLVAEIPKWIALGLKDTVIDFATFEHFQPRSTAELVGHFEENLRAATEALQNAAEEAFGATFYLKNQGQILYSSPMVDHIGSSINHLVHHRGQLTVYLRLNDLTVPSIYGPSADAPAF